MQYKLILNAAIKTEGLGSEREIQDFETIELAECPRVNEFLNYKNLTYKVLKVTHNLSFIELTISINKRV